MNRECNFLCPRAAFVFLRLRTFGGLDVVCLQVVRQSRSGFTAKVPSREKGRGDEMEAADQTPFHLKRWLAVFSTWISGLRHVRGKWADGPKREKQRGILFICIQSWIDWL